MKILVAGMGNVLRGDDAFGVEVARRLIERLSSGERPIPNSDLKVVEVGIGGIHLVHELMAGYDALVVIDAVERSSRPGTLHVLEAEVPALETWPEHQRQDFLADMHYTTPSKALILAKALNVLPPRVYILGCQPEIYDTFDIGFSEVVAQAIEPATARLTDLLKQLARSAA